MQGESSEAHEGQPVANLIFHLVIGQVIASLEREDFEHEDGIIRRPASLRAFGATQALLLWFPNAGQEDVSGKLSQGTPL